MHYRHFISFLDQALFSAGNFLLSVGLVRVYSETEFAGYGIALSVALLLLAVQRGFNIQAALLEQQVFAANARSLLAAHLIILGTTLGIALVAYAALWLAGGGALATDVAAASVACIAVFFQADVNRIFLIKQGRQVVSLGMTSLVLLAYATVIVAGYEDLASFREAMLWLAAAMVVMSALIVWRGVRPCFRSGIRQLYRDVRSVFAWTTFGTLASSAYSHIPLFALGMLQPPINAAAFVATRTLLQPQQIVIRSLDLVDKHLFSACRGDDHEGRRAAVMRALLRNFLLSLVATVPIALAAGPVLTIAYGQKFTAFAPALQLWLPLFVALAPIYPLETLIYSKGRPKAYACALVAAGLLTAAITYPLVALGSIYGAILACLFGCLLHCTAAAILALGAQGSSARPLQSRLFTGPVARRAH